MSRPIYEPSLQRTDARLGYGQNQLFRRPAPPSGSAEIPWARRSRGYDTSAEVIGTGTEKAIEFNHDYNYASGESGNGYFSNSGISDIEILQDGLYLITGEITWTVAHNFNYAVGIYDAIANWTHYSQGANVGADTTFSQVTLMHRYTASTNPFLHLVVTQTSGVNKSIDAAYLEVSYLGSWTGTDFLSMDPAQ